MRFDKNPEILIFLKWGEIIIDEANYFLWLDPYLLKDIHIFSKKIQSSF